nr:MAG TPA: hypothetical protein [Caudoviricetes sp.]DAX18214.1 MAG TPA: hypothetical protein [Caudoviricetes sp.]
MKRVCYAITTSPENKEFLLSTSGISTCIRSLETPVLKLYSKL